VTLAEKREEPRICEALLELVHESLIEIDLIAVLLKP